MENNNGINASEEAMPNTNLKAIAIIIGLIGVYVITSNSSALIIAFIGLTSMTFLGFSMFILVIGSIFIPILAAYLLWKKKKAGWVLSIFVLLLVLFKNLYRKYLSLKWSSSGSNQYALEDILPLFIIIIGGLAMLWYLNKGNIRKHFQINRNWQLISIIGSILLAKVLYIYLL